MVFACYNYTREHDWIYIRFAFENKTVGQGAGNSSLAAEEERRYGYDYLQQFA